jgi:hypothetical protein
MSPRAFALVLVDQPIGDSLDLLGILSHCRTVALSCFSPGTVYLEGLQRCPPEESARSCR